MKITFLVPPVLDNTKPTERTSGCTYVVYPVPNIYELTVAAVLEGDGHKAAYLDCIEKKIDASGFENFLAGDDSDFYSFWTVNLGIENDLIAHSLIRKRCKDAYIIFMGPAPTYYTERFTLDERTFAVRGEPEVTASELLKSIETGADLSGVKGISFVKNSKRLNNPERPLIKNLGRLPFPARHLINRDYYHNPKLRLHLYTP
ncbi:MAG: B12-binding domain-containing radical SAM protein, partial [Bacteroidales bacterium]